MIFSSRCRHWFVICANLFRCNNHTESLLDPYTPPEMHPFGSVFESFPPPCVCLLFALMFAFYGCPIFLWEQKEGHWVRVCTRGYICFSHFCGLPPFCPPQWHSQENVKQFVANNDAGTFCDLTSTSWYAQLGLRGDVEDYNQGNCPFLRGIHRNG